MKVSELISQLQQQPEHAIVCIEIVDFETGLRFMRGIERLDQATSKAYGTAVVIELED